MMNFTNLILVLITLISSVQASLAPRTTPSYSNKSSSTSTASSSHTTDACCFVVQDTVNEIWWQETSYSSTYNVVNLTSLTTFLTPYPNGTSTRVETNVQVTNASFEWSFLVGINPITNYINDAPGPTEAATSLNGTVSSIVTGGVTVHSPAAFYAYSTVKIITVPAVTDSHGHKLCGTSSAFTNSVSFYGGNTDLLSFTSINSNAEAYFGGSNIAGQTESATYTTTTTDTFSYSDYTDTVTWTESSFSTYYVDSSGQPVLPQATPTGVTISLNTPFIYQPERGAKGEADEGQHCLQSTGTENYGYIPQTLLDFLVSNEQYSSQYPGLASCLPGGPSIIQITDCESVLPTVQYAGGDLTSSTVVIVTPPGAAKSQQQGSPNPPVSTNTPNPPATNPPNPPQSNSPNPPQTKTALPPPNNTPPTNPPANNPPANNPPANSPPPPSSTTSLGAIINSIIGGQPLNTPAPLPPSPIIVPSPTTIPINQAPPGLTGSTIVIGGESFVIVPSATTLPALPTQNIIIAGPTTIPVNQAPPGLNGITTTMSGLPYIIVPSATTIQGQPSPPTYSTSIISGTSYLLIPGPTSIPLSLAPSGLTGITSMISGTVFLLVPSATSVPAPTPPGSITVIGGTTELIINGPVTVPVVPGLQLTGSTIVVSGTTMVIVSGTQTVPVESGASVLPSYVQVSKGKRQKDLASLMGFVSLTFGVLLGLR